jgi:hypothetical protein
MDDMDASAAATPGVSLTTSFEKLFLSSVRLSSAATLFGVSQFESAVAGWQEGGGIGKQLDRFGTTVNSLTQCLVEEISPGKKEALDSVAEITKKLVHQSVEGMSLLDPRQVFRFAGTLAQRSSETISGWTGKKESSLVEEPQLAADVLAN